MAEVRIDGVLYVPVGEAISAHVDGDRILDALVTQWAGDGWREHYPDSPSYLRVVVSDTFEEGEGETVQEFVARLLAATSE